MRQKNLIILLFLSYSFVSLYSQKSKAKLDMSCFSILGEASDYFTKGKFEPCVTILESALKSCPYSKEEKEIVLELLAKAYLRLDMKDKADSVLLEIFRNNPHYKLKEPEDDEEYILQSRKYKSHALISLGVRNTASSVFYVSTHINSVLNGLDYASPYKHSGFSFLYYGWLEYEFIQNMSINADLIFFWSSFQRVISKDPSFYLQYYEKHNFMEVPLYLRRYFPVKEHLLPYALIGCNFKYMYKARANTYISYTKDDLVTGKNTDFYSSIEDIDVLPMRNKYTYDWILGAGLGYKLKNLRMYLDIRYYGAINSFTNPSKITNPDLRNDFFYIDNSVKINQFEFGASISYTLFNSIKKKN